MNHKERELSGIGINREFRSVGIDREFMFWGVGIDGEF
jgi:hypothetical protein